MGYFCYILSPMAGIDRVIIIMARRKLLLQLFWSKMQSENSDDCDVAGNDTAKRVYTSKGGTPGKPTNKSRRISRLKNSTSSRTLFQSPGTSPKFPIRKFKLTPPNKSPVKHHKWTFDEDKAFVEFISVAKTDPKYGKSSVGEWPAFSEKNSFWSDGAKHIQCSTSSNILLSDRRLRGRVTMMYRKKFATLEDAEVHYGLTLSDGLAELVIDRRQANSRSVKAKPKGSSQAIATPPPPPPTTPTTPTSNTQPLPTVENAFKKLTTLLDNDQLENLLNKLFLHLALAHNITSNPGNYCSMSIKAMELLKMNNKNNLLYKFALALCNTKPGTNEPVFPMDRMPFGLVEYQIEFFSCTHIKQIKMPDDFLQWHESMCAEFPTRFNRLFRGPMWSGVDENYHGYPIMAKVNVASISTRTVATKTASSQFSDEPIIQEQALKDMKAAYPSGRFWIKGDGCDIKPALQQSVKGVWNGDSDLGDGTLQNLRNDYEQRLKTFKKLASPHNDIEKVMNMIEAVSTDLETDKQFLTQGVMKAQKAYTEKCKKPNPSKKVLMELSWERVEYSELLLQCQCLLSYVKTLKVSVGQSSQVLHVQKSMCEKTSDWEKYMRNLFIKRRQPAATHVFIFLLSDERRNKKPYCLPIQYLPYHSLKDQTVRELTNNIRQEMANLGMLSIGFVTDGEFNSLRTKGEKRPLHVVQLIRDARESVSKKSKGFLLKLIVRTGVNDDGKPVTEKADPAIPSDVINLLHNLRQDGLSLFEALKCIRISLVPEGYEPYPFRNGVEESQEDMLKSIIGTYRFRDTVSKYVSVGIDFSTYIYIPEIDDGTGEAFHEREDHCHILKRIWKHTREEGPRGTNLQGFDDAMRNPGTGLTFAALTGERKQSVVDAERMLSYLVAKFLSENGYEKEGEYINIVAGWHEAADGRGLSELERCKKNYAMLNMILDDWMPWHKTTPNFATIDINRPIKGICGFSRETVIAVTTNIESIEYRRRESGRIGYPEHPRAGTSDDVEAFISLLHGFLGNIFTVKEMKSLWRKVVREYCKRIDEDLPFYYWTSNERFREFGDAMPSFNEAEEVPDDIDAADDPRRLHGLTVNRREDSSIFAAGRLFLPARNLTTVRQRLHRPVVEPPLLEAAIEGMEDLLEDDLMEDLMEEDMI